MRTRKTGPDDIPALKALWKQACGDTDAEIDSFFKTVYPEATGFCAEEDGAVIAMLFALPLTLAHGEEMQKAAYLYAVATDEAFRGRGVCRALMEFAERTLRKRNIYEKAIYHFLRRFAFPFLSPRLCGEGKRKLRCRQKLYIFRKVLFGDRGRCLHDLAEGRRNVFLL